MTRSDLRRLLAIIALAFVLPAADVLHTVSTLSAGVSRVDPQAMKGWFVKAPDRAGVPVASASGPRAAFNPATFDLAGFPHLQPAASLAPTRLILRPAVAIIRALPSGRTEIWISRS